MNNEIVMAGLDPAIHLLCIDIAKMDARIKSAHDGLCSSPTLAGAVIASPRPAPIGPWELAAARYPK